MADHSPLLLEDGAIGREADRLLGIVNHVPHRFRLGIAGIAASGKSTLAERISEEINRRQPGAAVFLPLDGFHLSNDRLADHGWTSRKGAAFTYDAQRYIDLLRRFGDPTEVGTFPVYCREVHEPVESNQRVTAATRLIVTEGQYLLLDESPWEQLSEVLDETWWIDLDPVRARQWLMQRDTGVGRSRDEAEAKYQVNDRLNTAHVLAARREPDRIVCWPE